ncbi:MAG: polysaccharide lyase family protein [Candidatus Gastranaerophilales bacterium]|nr:polysaccharide lyase family protein [Candidatus Gastranaerophilales bacterium]
MFFYFNNSATVKTNQNFIILSNKYASFAINKKNGSIAKYQLKNFSSEKILLKSALNIYYRENNQLKKINTNKVPLKYKIIKSDKNIIDVCFVPANKNLCVIDFEIHLVMTSKTKGLYCYIVNKKTNNLSIELEEEKYYFSLKEKDFSSFYLDSSRNGLLPQQKDLKKNKEIMDCVYKLSEDKYYTKYSYIIPSYLKKFYSAYGKNTALSLIIPSEEYFSGTPLKQELTVHQSPNNINLNWYLYSRHYGTELFTPEKNWQKIYGPILIYPSATHNGFFNLKQVEKQSEIEKKLWPYQWLTNPLFMAKERFSFSGYLKDTHNKPIADAFVVLSVGEENWRFQKKDYVYFSKTNSNGYFEIKNIRPKTYTIFGIKNGIVDELKITNKKIDKNTKNNLIIWNNTCLKNKFFQIGIPNRSAKEFLGGNFHNKWGSFKQYKTKFPKGMDYFEGKSDYSKDIFYFSPAVLNPKDTSSDLRIHFSLKKQPTEDLTLIVAIASSVKTTLNIKINNKMVKDNLSLGFPEIDSASYRAATEGIYRIIKIKINKKDFNEGQNIITLHPIKTMETEASGLMYDTIILGY